MGEHELVGQPGVQQHGTSDGVVAVLQGKIADLHRGRGAARHGGGAVGAVGVVDLQCGRQVHVHMLHIPRDQRGHNRVGPEADAGPLTRIGFQLLGHVPPGTTLGDTGYKEESNNKTNK